MTTNSWIGGGGAGNFGTEGTSDSNWSQGHTPTSTEDAVVNTGATQLFLTAASNEDVGSISLGESDSLSITNASVFSAVNGTGSNVNNGLIQLNNADLLIGNTSSLSSFDNSAFGGISLFGTSANSIAAVFISGSVNLVGSGVIEMATYDKPGFSYTHNVIAGDFLDSSTPNLTNLSEDISGSGTIGGNLNFTNNATVETNNSLNSNGTAGTLVIEGSAAVGSFINSGVVQADVGGTLVFGLDGHTSTIVNNDEIQLNGTDETTGLEIAGNVTINGSSTGEILLNGSETVDQIASDGKSASLTLVNQSLQGAGSVADANLTLTNESVIDANNQQLTLGTGSNTITNSAGAVMEATNGALLGVYSAVNNAGTIEALQGSSIQLGQPITGSGAIDIGPSAEIIVLATISSNVTFTGSHATLVIANNLAGGGIGGEVVGATLSDVIDISSIETPFSATNSLRWNQTSASGGTLSLVSSSGTTLASLVLGGSFIASDFSMSSDGHGGTRATIVAAMPWSTANDYNADGISDLLWRNNSTESLVTWLMNGAAVSSGTYVTYQGNTITPDSSWSVAGIGDFNGDGNADILWRQSTTGTLVDWTMNGSAVEADAYVTYQGNAIVPDSSWSVAGIGDFNGDGKADILWRQSTTGTLVEWQMNGSQVALSNFVTSQGSPITPDSSWSVAGIGDFNGDGDADVLWRQSTTGSLAMWLMNGSAVTSGNIVTYQGNAITPDSTWSVVEVGDFNGTNQAGILWQQSTTGTLVEWQMNGAQIASAQTVTSGGNPIAPANTWQVQSQPTDFT